MKMRKRMGKDEEESYWTVKIVKSVGGVTNVELEGFLEDLDRVSCPYWSLKFWTNIDTTHVLPYS